MPRHRIETQRSRTLWPAAGQTARRVPVRAAGGRAKPSHAKEAVAPEWRQRLARNQRRMLKRAGRRLLVSPWFAAGAGVVIATGGIVYVPHANLDFGGAIQVTHCKQATCNQLTPNGVAPLQVGPGKPVTAPSSTSALAGMTFSYQVLEQSQGEFLIQMTIHSRHHLGLWTLSFVIPGARDVYVVYARWQQSGTNGGIASNYIGSTESTGYASISGQQTSDGLSSQDGDTVQFLVRGSGPAGPPADCSYNGTTCHFQPSYSRSGAN